MIRTQRLILRKPQAGDLADLHAIMSDPVAMRYWSTDPHATLDETKAYLDGMISNARAHDYMVREITDPTRVIGKAGCWNETAEVGMIFAPSVWGRGYAAEALHAILPLVFADDPKLERIWADIDPCNTASARVLEKLGFSVTGHAQNTFLVNGIWTHSTYYALPRPN